jgi:hypothetical protein
MLAPYPALAARHTFRVRSDESCLPDIRRRRVHPMPSCHLSEPGVPAAVVLLPPISPFLNISPSHTPLIGVQLSGVSPVLGGHVCSYDVSVRCCFQLPTSSCLGGHLGSRPAFLHEFLQSAAQAIKQFRDVDRLLILYPFRKHRSRICQKAGVLVTNGGIASELSSSTIHHPPIIACVLLYEDFAERKTKCLEGISGFPFNGTRIEQPLYQQEVRPRSGQL